MREFPVFLPYKGAHLAAVIAVPESSPRGLAVLLTGGSAARSHRYQVWTKTAERLADNGVASIRIDYRGAGDSTGVLRRVDLSDPPVDEVVSAVRFAMHAVGVDRVAAVGNCLGSLVALHLARQVPGSVGTMCILAPVLRPSGISKVILTLGSNAFLRRVVVKPLVGRKKGTTTGVRGPVTRALECGPLLFLYSEDDFTFNREVRRELEHIWARLPEQLRARWELRLIKGKGLAGFQSLSVQELVIDIVVEWMTDRFPIEKGPAGPVPSSSAPANREL